MVERDAGRLEQALDPVGMNGIGNDDMGMDLLFIHAAQSLMSAFLMISPNDTRSRSIVAAKAAESWKLA